jgi:hypothetical protein
MPPSPYKRNRRMKSRLTAGSDDDRVNLRTKAVDMMRRTGGAMAPDQARSTSASERAEAPSGRHCPS